MDWSTQFPELLGTLLLVTLNFHFGVMNLGFFVRPKYQIWSPTLGFVKKLLRILQLVQNMLA
jgi:hypothetical protein